MIENFFNQHGIQPTYWVAFSGGLDSYVLLSLCAQYQQSIPIKLRAIHVNHHLSQHATLWALQCKKICAHLNVEFYLREVDAKTYSHESPEAYAREKRYQVFKDLLHEGDFLLTAHQQNDQAETLLLQMLRGSGPKGLSAMPMIKPLGKGFHARPLINYSRQELKEYAQRNHLKWIDDESNIDLNFSRNFIRHQVLPVLQKRWPSVTKTLARVAKNCAETQLVFNEFIKENLLEVKGSTPQTLSISKLLKYDEIRQRHLIRAWLQQLKFPLPSFIKIKTIQTTILLARSDKMPIVTWESVQLRRYRDDLYALPNFENYLHKAKFNWDLEQPLNLPGLGVLKAYSHLGKGICHKIREVTVAFREKGETFSPYENSFRHSLKNFFQEKNIPPWQRNRIPLIFVDGELAAAVGFFVCEKFTAKPGELGRELTLAPASSI